MINTSSFKTVLFLFSLLFLFLPLSFINAADWLSFGKCTPDVTMTKGSAPKESDTTVCEYNASVPIGLHLKWDISSPTLERIPGFNYPCILQQFRDGSQVASWTGTKRFGSINYVSSDSSRVPLNFKDDAYVPDSFWGEGLENGDIFRAVCTGVKGSSLSFNQSNDIRVLSCPIAFSTGKVIPEQRINQKDPKSALLYKAVFPGGYEAIDTEETIKEIVSLYNKMQLKSNCQALTFPNIKNDQGKTVIGNCRISVAAGERGSYRDWLDETVKPAVYHQGVPEPGHCINNLSPHGAGLALDFICDATSPVIDNTENACGVANALISRIKESGGGFNNVLRECTKDERAKTSNSGTGVTVHIDLCPKY